MTTSQISPTAPEVSYALMFFLPKDENAESAYCEREGADRQADSTLCHGRCGCVPDYSCLLSLGSGEPNHRRIHVSARDFSHFCAVGTSLFDLHGVHRHRSIQLLLSTTGVALHYRRSAKLGCAIHFSVHRDYCQSTRRAGAPRSCAFESTATGSRTPICFQRAIAGYGKRI